MTAKYTSAVFSRNCMVFSRSSVSSRYFGCIVAPLNFEFEPVQIKQHLLPSWEYQGMCLNSYLHHVFIAKSVITERHWFTVVAITVTSSVDYRVNHRRPWRHNNVVMNIGVRYLMATDNCAQISWYGRCMCLRVRPTGLCSPINQLLFTF